MNIITSKANSLVKNTKKLHRKKYRTDSYLIEGWHLFEEALAAKAPLGKIFTLPEFSDRVQGLDQVVFVSPEVLKELSDAPSPQGVVAEVKLTKETLPSRISGRWLFLEDVQDPGNVGTMVRTADAAGFSGVLLSDKAADLYNMKTLRSMQGSHFHLPVSRVSVQDALDWAKESGVSVWATTLSQDSVDYRTLETAEDLLLVMGNEGQGISDLVAERADIKVHISMTGKAESLNVAVAAGIMMFSLI